MACVQDFNLSITGCHASLKQSKIMTTMQQVHEMKSYMVHVHEMKSYMVHHLSTYTHTFYFIYFLPFF